MKIGVIGSENDFAEVRKKFDSHHDYVMLPANQQAVDVVFDFSEPGQHGVIQSGVIFYNTVFISLNERNPPEEIRAFGFCGWPTFLDREFLEVCIRSQEDINSLETCCRDLGTGFKIVKDQVGMITPRVIGMIINEAYSTVEEGTATREDIDLAMKLGTNYPYGPFEWCKKIGASNVAGMLNKVYQESGDPRYRVNPLLEKEK